MNFFFLTQSFTIFGLEMRVAVFFICLCILLLRGYDYMYAGSHHNIIPAQNIEKTHTSQDYAVIKDAGSDKEEEYFFSDEVEDEDSLFARKYKLLGKYYFIFSYLFILRYLYSCSKAPLIFCSPLSYKYITQKTLRI
ncbi:hypothetical protein SAMN05518672_113165 [Chitinophaga sp. CF118]|uniref:hypothetical protein n=1 Tax=Chitinophaga sp. CF118 TaxID=1884367 RepID=UPI0008E43508|nr:hypothetical protein [Chitinophaga sp. CF118]SFE98663.1 hypothetical protein SAMN05518672_113165 [Chitinophaga sp. CF118]